MACDVLGRFYERGKLRREDPIEEIFRPSVAGAPKANYLAFLSFINELELPPGAEIWDRFRTSKRGRRFFGVRIGKAPWKSRADNESDGVSTRDPDNRNIHIEPQLDALSGRFELYIH